MGIKKAHIDPNMPKMPIWGQKPKIYRVPAKLVTNDNCYQILRINNYFLEKVTNQALK